MTYIDISNTDKANLESLFYANEIYANSIYVKDDKFGYVELGSSNGEIFYFIKGKLENGYLVNTKKGYKIKLS